MLILKSLSVSSFDSSQLTLTWAFQPTVELLSDYTLDIYRSENPGIEALDGYDLIASGIASSAYSYDDSGVSGLFDPLRVWYYKLKLTYTPTSATSVQPDRPGYRKGVVADKLALDIIRRKSISLDRHSGRDFYVLKRRTFGTHCPTCWDETLQRSKESTCVSDPSCYGTGWTTGYFNSIYAKGMMNATPKYNQITMFGQWMPQDTLFTMLNFPPLRSQDVIVDENNKRWIVKQVKPVEKNGFLIEQNAQCSLIALDDIVYTIDNDVGALSDLPAVTITPNAPNRYAHLVTKAWLEENYPRTDLYFQRFVGTDRVTHANGSRITVTNQVTAARELQNGSVQLTINGLEYISETDQTDSSLGTDFYITGNDIIVNDLAHSGTITLKDTDIIGVFYQFQAI